MEPTLPYTTTGLSLLLTMSLFSCQPGTALEPTAEANQAASNTSYLFNGNPGILTPLVTDVSGQMTGTVDGLSMRFGTDQTPLLESQTGFVVTGAPRPSLITVAGRYLNYGLAVSLREPFRVGTYKWVETGRDLDQDQTAVALYYRGDGMKPGINLFAVTKPNRSVRLTSVTPESIEGELVFTLDKPNATEERLTFRIKNQLAENSNLRDVAPADPFWNYRQTTRTLETAFLFDSTNRTMIRSGVRRRIYQTTAQSMSNMVLGGTTYPVNGQGVSLDVGQGNVGPSMLDVSLNNGPSNSSWPYQRVFFNIPNFRGVGTYESTAVSAQISDALAETNWAFASSRTTRLSNTQTRVIVTRVTPDVIEGTYSFQNISVQQRAGTQQPNTLSATGTFKVIYPR